MLAGMMATHVAKRGACPQSSCCAGSAPEARPTHADLVTDSLLAENAQKYRTADGTEHQLTAKLCEMAKAQRLYAEGRAIVRRKRGRYFSLEREACLDYVLMHGGEPAYC